MKIPFDIKYRPQIESGEYKVETRSGKNVKIICWDKIGVPIVALVGDAEDIIIYDRNGTTGQQMSLPSDLFIIIPEPELYESEDERIRKYFIWIVKNVLSNIQGLKLSEEQTKELIGNYSGIKVSDMLSYLEKQKEQKPKIIIPKFRIGEYIKPRPYNEKHLIKDINENGYVLDVDFVVPFKDDDVWEVVEQRPVEWRPTKEQFNYLAKAIMTLGEKGDCRTAGVLSEIRNGLKCSFPDWKMSSDYPKEGCNVSLNGEIKKIQEWSEEDEKMLNNIQYLLHTFIYGSAETGMAEYKYQKEIDWLKALSKSTIKWSAEDEKIHNGLVRLLDLLFENDNYLTEVGIDAGVFKRWLKSLRPSWKPSEEQMKALREAVFTFDGYEEYDALKSLYKQLKKLM